MNDNDEEQELIEIERLGDSIFHQLIEKQTLPSDIGKFAAIDIDQGTFEIDRNSFQATSRLKQKNPLARVWVWKIGSETSCRVGKWLDRK